MLVAKVEHSSPPKPDGLGRVVWEVEIAGRTFVVGAFLDDAYGLEIPLFELPMEGEPLHAALAVNTAFADWENNHDVVHAMLRAAAEVMPHRLLPPPPSVEEEPANAEPLREVLPTGPPEVTDREEVRIPVAVDGIPLIAAISMDRVPGFEDRWCHVGSIGTEESDLIHAVMQYAQSYLSANRPAVEAMLAESHAKRLAAGLTDDDIDPPQPPRPRVPTRAHVARVFKTPRGRLVFTATLDGAEHLVDAHPIGSLGWSSNHDCLNAVVYFILDNAELMTALGLNMEVWEAWR